MCAPSTPRKGIVLEGDPNGPAFIFIHGLGTTPADLHPLARAFNQLGFPCEILQLAGHGGNSENLRNAAYAQWLEQLEMAHQRFQRENRPVFLVGFSLGATLAIDFAIEHPVAGVLAISSFFTPTSPRLARLVLAVVRRLPKARFRRRLQTTVRQTRRELSATPHLPVESCDVMLDAGRRTLQRVHLLRCPLLLLHSLSDRLASYDSSAWVARSSGSATCRLVTLHGLNHFLQFDVAPPALRDLALQFFGLEEGEQNVHPRESHLAEAIEQCREDARHWSRILFQLILAFFSVFGALVYFSLKEILQGEDKAPHFLVAYALVSSVYVLLASLYFFYLNRVTVFLKHHIEPQIRGLPWVTYRTLRPASGNTSLIMSRLLAAPILALPLVISASAIAYAVGAYPDRFMELALRNVFLQASLCCTFGLLVVAVLSVCQLLRYTNTELYRIPRTRFANPAFEASLCRFFEAVAPGCVQQLEPQLSQH